MSAVPKLSLLNFDLPSSHCCQYVLTSPRSLRACHKANIKPVELLYKSRAEFVGEGGNPDQLYWNHESARQKKLARCIKVRNNIIKAEVMRSSASVPRSSALSGHNSTTPRHTSPELPDLRGVSPNWTTSGIGTSPELSSTKDEVSPRKPPGRLTVTLAPGPESDLPPRTDFKPFEKQRSSSRLKGYKGMSKKKQRARDRAVARSHSEERMETLLPNSAHMLLKYHQIKQNCVERGVRAQEAERAQRDLAEWVQQWQDRVLVEQWAAVTRAQLSANRILQDRISTIKQNNFNKRLNHSVNMNRVKEDEEERAELLRRQVESKGRRIEGLQEERNRAIHESRARSHAITEEHQQVRKMMTPETFDQKVQKYNINGRMSCGTPLTMHASHIILG